VDGGRLFPLSEKSVVGDRDSAGSRGGGMPPATVGPGGIPILVG
jgi:hypothetical protein